MKPITVQMTPELIKQLHEMPAVFGNTFTCFLMTGDLVRLTISEIMHGGELFVRGSYLVSIGDIVNLKHTIDNVISKSPQAQKMLEIKPDTAGQVPGSPPLPDTEKPAKANDFIEQMKRQAKNQ